MLSLYHIIWNYQDYTSQYLELLRLEVMGDKNNDYAKIEYLDHRSFAKQCLGVKNFF